MHVRTASLTVLFLALGCESSGTGQDAGANKDANTNQDGSPYSNMDASDGEGGTLCNPFVGASVAAGNTGACAIESDGTLFCWGINTRGAIGDGTTDGELCIGVSDNCRLTPTKSLSTSVAQVSVGDSYACVRKKDGTLWCFGNNGYGELGLGTNTGPACNGFCQPTPTEVTAVGTVLSVSAAESHACAVKTDGTVWCWGVNGNGELGDGTTTGQACGGLFCKPTPVQVLNLTNVAEVASAYTHSCARKTDGTVWCWGDNNDGQCGDGTEGSPVHSTPGQAIATNVAEIAVNSSYTCARKTDGTLWCWGANQYGELGNGTTTGSPTPVQVTALGTNVAQITLGAHFGCALETDSTVWCWGSTGQGQLGNGQTMGGSQCISGRCETSPVQVTGLTDAAQVTAGRDFACARKKTGAIVCWGNSANGLLGEGTYRAKISCASSYCEPAPVPVCQ